MKYSASEPERQVVYAYADDIKAKDAEIERLRAALEKIIVEGDKPLSRAMCSADIARAALANS